MISTFQEFSTILEMDATTTTFKYALLRAVTDICQNYTHLKELDNDRVWFPTGLIVEKWMMYYWPLFGYHDFIPQKPREGEGKRKLMISFRKQFLKVIAYYKQKNGLSGFYLDYCSDNIPEDINDELLDLMKKIRYTITRYPMKHLGYSVYRKHYSIFDFQPPNRVRKQPLTRDLIIKQFGKFSIPLEYFQVFSILGGFISGTSSILSQWASFTEYHSNEQITYSDVYKLLLEQPITEREVNVIRNYYEKLLYSQGKLLCVWSGKSITKKNQLHLDHLIPFSKWHNNDIWNLLPTHITTNIKKRDLIPSVKLLKARKQVIINYWSKVGNKFPKRFKSEIKLSLIGFNQDSENLKETAFNGLIDKVDYMIKYRGYAEWDG